MAEVRTINEKSECDRSHKKPFKKAAVRAETTSRQSATLFMIITLSLGGHCKQPDFPDEMLLSHHHK